MGRVYLAAVAVLASSVAAACGSTSGGAPTNTPTSTLTVTDTGSSTAPPPATTTPATARLVVLKVGVTTDSFGTANYGIVIENPTGSDAEQVQFQVNLVRGSEILATDSPQVSLIPAHTTFYLAGGTNLSAPRPAPTGVKVSSSIGSSVPAKYPNIKVSQLSVGSQFGQQSAHAVITNNTTGTLSSLAQVFVVWFGSGGQVVGGDQTFLPNKLAPRASAAINDPILGASGLHVAHIRVSCENVLAGAFG